MDIPKNFKDSFNQLKKEPRLAVPYLLINVLMMLMAVGTYYVYDLMPIHLFPHSLKYLTMQSGVTYTALAVIGVLLMLYLSCLARIVLAQTVRKKTVEVSTTAKEAVQKFFPYLGLNIAVAIAKFFPILITGTLFWYYLTIGQSVSVIILLILLMLAAIALSFWLVLRLYFVESMYFVDDENVAEALVQGFQCTRNRIRDVFIVFAVLFGIGYLASVLLYPLLFSLIELMKPINTSSIAASLLVVLILTIAYSLILAFQQLFLFNSYKDFKGGR